ncbi:hypothetical protein M407DRAFT_29087 [Tulasnella calospora MUT 4182]|uniref:Uncharacterized protein n=1 Tax=Tulasnella calospora MUT 4182 TaxID=1051891 RepID=A0A0C3LIT5_9AGAM|nr:hypothetical protein M407DRAFT_29087 [Tulasnella calospora MUT 4182]
MLFSTVVAALGLASSAHAWGQLGHKTVANVALQFLQPGVRDTLTAILAADGHNRLPNPSIVDVATWADGFSHSPEGTWTKGFHYIDAKDDPPLRCDVDLSRDCRGPGGCVVTAIANYTDQLIHPSRNVDETAQALKFVVHFLGDITQPLHTENFMHGGNGINVKWHGKKAKLHGVWDTGMIAEFFGSDNATGLDSWTKRIVNEIKNGSYKDAVPEWLSCSDINDAVNCATQWAVDTNKLICDFVLKTTFHKNEELPKSYYDDAIPIIQRQVAKGGVRLASWLNQIFGTAEPGSLSLYEQDRLVLQLSEVEF